MQQLWKQSVHTKDDYTKEHCVSPVIQSNIMWPLVTDLIGPYTVYITPTPKFSVAFLGSTVCQGYTTTPPTNYVHLCATKLAQPLFEVTIRQPLVFCIIHCIMENFNKINIKYVCLIQIIIIDLYLSGKS